MLSIEVSQAQSTRHVLAFSKVVMATLFSDNFKMSSITPYDAKGDVFKSSTHG